MDVRQVQHNKRTGGEGSILTRSLSVSPTIVTKQPLQPMHLHHSSGAPKLHLLILGPGAVEYFKAKPFSFGPSVSMFYRPLAPISHRSESSLSIGKIAAGGKSPLDSALECATFSHYEHVRSWRAT
jgi:hypothetical protein